MPLKTFKPNTPSTRQLVIVERSGLHKGKPVKSLTRGLTKKAGRNNRLLAEDSKRAQDFRELARE